MALFAIFPYELFPEARPRLGNGLPKVGNVCGEGAVPAHPLGLVEFGSFCIAL